MLDEGALKDYVKVSQVEPILIQEYREQLPEEMIIIWEKYGFGTFLDGYLKVINPNDYSQLLEESYFLGKQSKCTDHCPMMNVLDMFRFWHLEARRLQKM